MNQKELVLLRQLVEVEILHELVDHFVAFLELWLCKVLILLVLHVLVFLVHQNVHSACLRIYVWPVAVLDVSDGNWWTMAIVVVVVEAHLARIVADIIALVHGLCSVQIWIAVVLI